jgi:Domain of unknown function (DUF4116)
MSDTRPRLEKIIDLYGQALFDAISQREPTLPEAHLSNRDLVLRFAGADPTNGKSRTQWLVKTYIADEQFKLEDLGRVDAALAAFERFKRKLPVEQRELSQFKSLRMVEALVDPFVGAEAKARLERDLSSATGREKRRLEELKARDESIIIQEQEGLPTIAVPMTEFASKWWGRGTKWCTASEKENAFENYHTDAPLIVIVCPDGEKFQAHVTKENFQFMDATDQKVNEKTVWERWDELKSLIYWALEQNGMILKYVPEEHRNLELCCLAIEQNGMALQFIPENKRIPELCQIAIEQNGWALWLVPKKHHTSEVYRVAVEQNGWALEYIPVDNRTPELCRLAVEKDGRALRYVPVEYRAALYHFAVERNGRSLYDVPTNYRTPELCLLAVQKAGQAIGDVPTKYITPELCRLAVEQDGRALGDIPRDNRTAELCLLAVKQNGMALQYVPDEHLTPKLYRLAVQRDGRALEFVPRYKRTPTLCRLAVEQGGLALGYVPEKHKTPAFLALIPPIQPKWHPDILRGLDQHSQSLQNSKTQGIIQL